MTVHFSVSELKLRAVIKRIAKRWCRNGRNTPDLPLSNFDMQILISLKHGPRSSHSPYYPYQAFLHFEIMYL